MQNFSLPRDANQNRKLSKAIEKIRKLAANSKQYLHCFCIEATTRQQNQSHTTFPNGTIKKIDNQFRRFDSQIIDTTIGKGCAPPYAQMINLSIAIVCPIQSITFYSIFDYNNKDENMCVYVCDTFDRKYRNKKNCPANIGPKR